MTGQKHLPRLQHFCMNEICASGVSPVCYFSLQKSSSCQSSSCQSIGANLHQNDAYDLQPWAVRKPPLQIHKIKSHVLQQKYHSKTLCTTFHTFAHHGLSGTKAIKEKNFTKKMYVIKLIVCIYKLQLKLTRPRKYTLCPQSTIAACIL